MDFWSVSNAAQRTSQQAQSIRCKAWRLILDSASTGNIHAAFHQSSDGLLHTWLCRDLPLWLNWYLSDRPTSSAILSRVSRHKAFYQDSMTCSTTRKLQKSCANRGGKEQIREYCFIACYSPDVMVFRKLLHSISVRYLCGSVSVVKRSAPEKRADC